MRILLTILKLLLRWKAHLWFPGYVRAKRRNRGSAIPVSKPIDIMVLVVDHFEPARIEGAAGVDSVRAWCEKYREIASAHRDSDGVTPQHTWFYRYDYPNHEMIKILSQFVYENYGEIEFHLHHGFDTPESFRARIQGGVGWFNQVGAMVTAEPTPRSYFGYIAGNWALDNGRRDVRYSGVNTEISILGELGCYADFTFPALDNTAQPRKVNGIYYAVDRPGPKSYDTGFDVEVGRKSTGGLMIVQGPVYVDWKRTYIESAAFEWFTRYAVHRLDYWEGAHIHVRGRPEWVFVKLHTHGMQSRDVFLGSDFHQMCEDLENRFKQAPYRLHYVNAREAYNIVKAAEAGKEGNPNDYRNYLLKEPVNKKIYADKPFRVRTYSENGVILEFLRPGRDTEVRFRETPLQCIRGNHVGRIEMEFSAGEISHLEMTGEGSACMEFRAKGPANAAKVETIELPFVMNRRCARVA
jgi:hypothetical protein